MKHELASTGATPARVPTAPRAHPLRIANRSLLLRVTVVVALVIVYYSIDWSPLQRVLAAVAAALLRALGHLVRLAGTAEEPALELAGRDFAVTASCTYLDLLLVLAPLCWRARLGVRRNAVRIALLATAVLVLNPLRVVVAIHLAVGGVPWTWAHGVPDIGIHGAAITLAALLAIRSDGDPYGARAGLTPAALPDRHYG